MKFAAIIEYTPDNKKEAIKLKDVTPDYLLKMEEDVLYEFCR